MPAACEQACMEIRCACTVRCALVLSQPAGPGAPAVVQSGQQLTPTTNSLLDCAKLCSAYFMPAAPWGAGSYRQGAEQLPWRRPINNRSGWHHPHPYQAPHPGTTYGRVSVPPNCMHACVLQKPVHSPMILAGNGRPKSALDRRAPGCGRWCVIRSKG